MSTSSHPSSLPELTYFLWTSYLASSNDPSPTPQIRPSHGELWQFVWTSDLPTSNHPVTAPGSELLKEISLYTVKLTSCYSHCFSCGSQTIGVDLISDAEWDWIKIWVLNVFASLMCYACARTAVKVQLQVRIQISIISYSLIKVSNTWIFWIMVCMLGLLSCPFSCSRK